MKKIGILVLLSTLFACSHAETMIDRKPKLKQNKQEVKGEQGIRFSKFEGRPVLVIDDLDRTEIVKSKLGAHKAIVIVTSQKKEKLDRKYKKAQWGSSGSSSNSLVSNQEEDDVALVRVSSGSGSNTFLICGQIQNPCEVTEPGIGSRHEGCGGTFDVGSGEEPLEDVFAANQPEIEQTCKSAIGNTQPGGNSI